MRLEVLAVFLGSAFAVGQTVSVGSASTVQSGNTTTITVPVTVSGGTTTTGSAPAAALPMLSVESSTTGGAQSVGAAFTTLTLGTVITDTANGWNAASNAYTVPNTGTYLIVSRVRLADGAQAGVSYGQGVNTSNVDGTFFQWTTTAGLRNESLNVRLVKLTAGQILDLYAYLDGPGSVWYASLTIQELN